jgi:hypothetical protein
MLIILKIVFIIAILILIDGLLELKFEKPRPISIRNYPRLKGKFDERI